MLTSVQYFFSILTEAFYPGSEDRDGEQLNAILHCITGTLDFLVMAFVSHASMGYATSLHFTQNNIGCISKWEAAGQQIEVRKVEKPRLSRRRQFRRWSKRTTTFSNLVGKMEKWWSLDARPPLISSPESSKRNCGKKNKRYNYCMQLEPSKNLTVLAINRDRVPVVS